MQAAAARHAPARDAPDWEPYWQLLDDLEARATKGAPKSALRPAAGRKPAGRKCARAGQCACQYGAEMLPMLKILSKRLGSSTHIASWQQCACMLNCAFSWLDICDGPLPCGSWDANPMPQTHCIGSRVSNNMLVHRRISFQAQRRRSRAVDDDEGAAPRRRAQRDPIQDPDEEPGGADAEEAAEAEEAADMEEAAGDAGGGSAGADAAGAGRLPSIRPRCAALCDSIGPQACIPAYDMLLRGASEGVMPWHSTGPAWQAHTKSLAYIEGQ